MKRYLLTAAGLVLAVFLMGCGHPSYRLNGGAQLQRVALLDSTTQVSVDSIQTEFEHLMESLAKSEVAAMDSISKSASELGPTILKAQQALHRAKEKYASVFEQMHRFRSFGGNPVFSGDDVGVSTEKLLNEIPGRFYKGRAFSLETEGRIRSFIRSDLVPIENEVNQAQYRVKSLRNAKSGRSKKREEMVDLFQEKKRHLIQATNEDIRNTIHQHRVNVVNVDTTGHYSFSNIDRGVYYLAGGDQDSTDYMIQVVVSAHTLQNISLQIGKPIFVSVKPDIPQVEQR
jgi:hypothetical protein